MCIYLEKENGIPILEIDVSDDFMSDERMDTIFDQVYTFVETNTKQ